MLASPELRPRIYRRLSLGSYQKPRSRLAGGDGGGAEAVRGLRKNMDSQTPEWDMIRRVRT